MISLSLGLMTLQELHKRNHNLVKTISELRVEISSLKKHNSEIMDEMLELDDTIKKQRTQINTLNYILNEKFK